jgi:2-polyprenyl-3-methyl-5-hydroxy-6-metoxy-1,4-benzoquinol methylase
MDIQEIVNSIEEIKIKLNKIELEIANYKSSPAKTETKTESQFEKLKNLLESEEWPEAVLDFQIVDENSDEEKMDRAEGVVDILVEENLENKKFLDFGCGEGHMAKYASKDAAVSVGYDINKSDKSKFNWENLEEKLLLTTSFEKVQEQGPYDIIMIYDVLDHADEPVEILEKAKSILSDNGKIYLRTHPWCGRHGGHLYRKKNKAFVHVVFSDEELKQMDLVFEERNNKVKFPIAEYDKIIKSSGLVVASKDTENQEVEDFFEKNQLVSQRLKEAIRVDGGKTFPKFQMSQCFHDYALKR